MTEMTHKENKGQNFLKNLLENREIGFKNGVMNIHAMGYNGVHTVYGRSPTKSDFDRWAYKAVAS